MFSYKRLIVFWSMPKVHIGRFRAVLLKTVDNPRRHPFMARTGGHASLVSLLIGSVATTFSQNKI